METFSALLALCAGNSPVTGEFPSQRPVMRSFDVFFDLRLNKRLSNHREADDLRRYCAHYDVIVMYQQKGNSGNNNHFKELTSTQIHLAREIWETHKCVSELGRY